MKEDKKLMIFTDWFTPAFKAGGPVKSVHNLVNLIHKDFKIQVVTSDTDEGDALPMSEITADKWQHVDGISVIYLSERKRNLRSIALLIDEHRPDVCYFNSLFSIKFTIVPLFLLKNNSKVNPLIVLAPRGMLGEGALALKKGKKQLFLTLSRIFKFYRGIRWHATADTERQEIQKHFGNNVNILVEPNIPNTEFKNVAPQKQPGKLNLVFVSRISPKKNLDFALDCLVSMEFTDQIQFDVYGPIEDPDYWDKCERLINKMPSNIEVQYKGAVTPSQLNAVWSNYHALLFPTMHENFGHVIFEALSSGIPVVLSEHTPWRNLQSKKLGFDLPLEDKHKWQQVILHMVQWTEEEYKDYSRNCVEYAASKYNLEELRQRYIQLFQA